MRYRLRALFMWIVGLFPAWEWQQLRTKRFNIGLAVGMLGSVVAAWGAESHPLVMIAGLIFATVGVAIASIWAGHTN